MERLLCPRHSESTPSCIIYPTHAYCYGGCGRIELSELGLTAEAAPKERYIEDLNAALEYVDTLPKKIIRGFNLPYDERGYYLVWPNRKYYKRRNWKDEGSKYKNPSGHSQPPFWVRRDHNSTLALVEGEFNAMSLGLAFPEWDVCSPGSASDFKADKTRHFLLTYCTAYSTVVIMVDRDGPGTEAAIHAKGLLLNKVTNIPIVLMQKDANEILVESGKEGLREEITKSLPELRKGIG